MRKVSATISRRDVLRKYMDVIEAMLARSGALRGPRAPGFCCIIAACTKVNFRSS